MFLTFTNFLKILLLSIHFSLKKINYSSEIFLFITYLIFLLLVHDNILENIALSIQFVNFTNTELRSLFPEEKSLFPEEN